MQGTLLRCDFLLRDYETMRTFLHILMLLTGWSSVADAMEACTRHTPIGVGCFSPVRSWPFSDLSRCPIFRCCWG
ncbi:hypothetical protein BRAS3843_2550026 [Bradyrhizobium sp. STM 3843]|nr:hypothetical protein BRAS3843_2550026 [Bradyrhizobium sp. STM 3843]